MQHYLITRRVNRGRIDCVAIGGKDIGNTLEYVREVGLKSWMIIREKDAIVIAWQGEITGFLFEMSTGDIEYIGEMK